MGEIEKLMQSANVSMDYRIINLGGKSLYIEGFKCVVSIGENELVFQMKKGVLFVKGCNFNIKYLDKTTCVIAGEIKLVEQR